MLIFLSSSSRSVTISKSGPLVWSPTLLTKSRQVRAETRGDRPIERQTNRQQPRQAILGKIGRSLGICYFMWEACPGHDSPATDCSALYSTVQQAPANSPSRGSPCTVPTTRRQDFSRPLCAQGRYWCHVAAGPGTSTGPLSSKPSAGSDRLWGRCHSPWPRILSYLDCALPSCSLRADAVIQGTPNVVQSM